MTTGDSSTSLFVIFQIQLLCQDHFSTTLEQSTVKDVMTTKGSSAPPFHNFPDIMIIKNNNYSSPYTSSYFLPLIDCKGYMLYKLLHIYTTIQPSSASV